MNKRRSLSSSISPGTCTCSCPARTSLAIHGMTLSESNPDGLILPVLEGRFPAVEEVHRYFHTPHAGREQPRGVAGASSQT